jgi:putative hydrolase of the HAD superfamily
MAARVRPLRAVLFDAGNTLLRMNYAAIAAELARRGVPVSAAELERAEWRARVRLDDEVLARRAPGVSTESGGTGDRYLRYILEAAGVRDQGIVEDMAEWRRTYNPPVGVWSVAAPDAREALERVRAAGLVAGVVSNSNGSVRSILDTLGLARHLHFVLDSAEVGVEKPDPRIFGLALERAAVEPDEAAYVGDLYSVDVVGARAAGIQAVLLDPGGCWGARDCPTARDALDAVRLLLGDRRRGPVAGAVTREA